MSHKMKATFVRIRNMLGIKELDVEPGQITVFEGRNDTGKTSAVAAIQSLVDNTSVKTLRNIHAEDDEPSEVVLTYDGLDGRIIARRDESGISVKRQVGDTAAFEDIPRPSEFLKDLARGGLANPIKFLNCNDKDRVQMLLEALPVEYDSRVLWSTIGLKEADLPAVPAGLHPLVEIAMHRQNIFERRRGINRDEKGKRDACEQTRRSVPAEIPTVDGLEELEEQHIRMRAEHREKTATLRQAAESDQNAELAKLAASEELTNSEMARFAEQVRREAEERIAAKRDELEKHLHDERNRAQEKIGDIQISLADALDKVNDALPEIEEIGEKIAVLKERLVEAERTAERHRMADQFEADAEELKADSMLHTAALASIDKFKAAMVSDLPIPGLDIFDNKITVDGVPWSQVNTARRIAIAVQVICLRFGDQEIRPLFMDGAEALDSTSFEIMVEELKRNDVQAFISRVSDETKIRKV